MEKIRKWDQVVEYLEITGVFVECDEEIVMEVLKMGTLNHEKISQLRQLFEKIDYDPERVDVGIMNQVKPLLASIYSKELRRNES